MQLREQAVAFVAVKFLRSMPGRSTFASKFLSVPLCTLVLASNGLMRSLIQH
jgi:hypothetical protein